MDYVYEAVNTITGVEIKRCKVVEQLVVSDVFMAVDDCGRRFQASIHSSWYKETPEEAVEAAWQEHQAEITDLRKALIEIQAELDALVLFAPTRNDFMNRVVYAFKP